jgi:hypothetical protein
MKIQKFQSSSCASEKKWTIHVKGVGWLHDLDEQGIWIGSPHGTL